MKSARLAGVFLQGAVLGILLLVALVGLLTSETGARLFRYEGF